MKDKILGKVGLAIIFLAISMIAIGAYWLFVPVKVIEPQVQPYKVLTPVVAVGDNFVYQVDACKKQEATGAIYRSFVDEAGTAYPLPPTEGYVKRGCMKTNVPVIVPVLHAGTWHLTLDVGYKVNPLRTEYYHLSTDKFIIKR